MKALIIDRVSPLVASGLKEYGVEVDIQILPGVEELKQLLANYDLHEAGLITCSARKIPLPSPR